MKYLRQQIKDEYREFSNRAMIRTNFPGFIATVFYTSGLNALYLVQAVTILIALTVIAAGHSVALAAICAIVYAAGSCLRGNCESCGQIQGFMLIAFAVGKTPDAFTAPAIALFAVWFFALYITSKRIYVNSNNP